MALRSEGRVVPVRRPASKATVGAIPFASTVTVGVPASALCALATDLPRYVQAEPRLRQARWIGGGGPSVGASAEIVGDIPVSLPILSRVIGPPMGIATLEELDPGSGLAYSLQTAHARGYLRADFEEEAAGTVVRAAGWIYPRSLVGRLSLRPIAPLLSRLVTSAVTTCILRAAEALE